METIGLNVVDRVIFLLIFIILLTLCFGRKILLTLLRLFHWSLCLLLFLYLLLYWSTIRTVLGDTLCNITGIMVELLIAFLSDGGGDGCDLGDGGGGGVPAAVPNLCVSVVLKVDECMYWV